MSRRHLEMAQCEINNSIPPSLPGLMTAIDLFAGCGGATLGFKAAGFWVAAAVEIDPTSAGTYARNHPEVRVFTDDIRDLDVSTVLSACHLNKGDCGVLIACPPCQGFSTHRRGRGGEEDPRNDLVKVFADWVVAIRPHFFVFENVPEVKDLNLWIQVKQELEDQDYKIVQGLVEAADYGVPQRRKRFLAIGSRMGNDSLDLPQANFGKFGWATPKRPWKTVRDAIEDLPVLRSGEIDEADTMHAAPRHTAVSLERFAHIPRDGGSRRDLPEYLELACHQGHDGHKDVYGRLWWDKPSGTITGGCTQPSKGRFLHPQEDRGLTLRESARIQSFPDWYRFKGAKQQIAAQIGNAVPHLLASSVAFSIIKSILNNIEDKVREQAAVDLNSSNVAPFLISTSLPGRTLSGSIKA